MDEPTRRALAEINRRFYRECAGAYSQTRSRPSPGWERVVGHVARARPSILDVGCGNGRLCRYLATALGRAFEYVGVDASRELLDIARADLGSDARLVEHDFLAAPPDRMLPETAGNGHALVTLFNVLHHVPGRDRRRALVEAAAARVAPGGVLALAIWLFGERPRFADRIVPWTDPNAPAVEPSELEPGDHLLRWADSGVRYCHAMEDRESRDIAVLSGFSLVDRYDADGRSSDLNRYFVLVRGA